MLSKQDKYLLQCWEYSGKNNIHHVYVLAYYDVPVSCYSLLFSFFADSAVRSK